MLKLKSLTIVNAGRFLEKQSINLDSRSLLIQLDAFNKNTGGSSGSGKSTVFNSLEYLFGINEIPATVLQSRFTKDPITVEGVFDHDGEELYVSRSSKGGLTIKLPNETLSGNTKIAEEKLQQIIGIPISLFRRTIHKRQGEGGFFLSLTPSKCHEFMSECLDYKVWTLRADQAELDLKKYDARLSELAPHINSLQTLKTQLESTVSGFSVPTLSWSPEIFPSLEANLTNAERVLMQTKSDMQSALVRISKPVMVATSEPETLAPLKLKRQDLKNAMDQHRSSILRATQDIESKIRSKEVALNKIDQDKNDQVRLQLDFDRLKADISRAKEGSCPTCAQGWVGGNKDSMLESYIAQAKAVASEIALKKTRIESEPQIKHELVLLVQSSNDLKKELASPAAQAEIDTLDTEISRLGAELHEKRELAQSSYGLEMANARLQEDQIRVEFDTKLQFDSNNLLFHRDLLNKYKTEYSHHLSSVQKYELDKKSLQDRLFDTDQNLAKAQADLAEATRMETVCRESVRFLKHYTNYMFQGALDQIAAKATELLSKIPNMNTATIYFDTIKETKSGSVKEEITAILSMDGEMGVPVKSLSGGEQAAIDLAVDLAVIDMIEARSGKGLNLFILDEPFNGLDSICREQCLELLKTNTSNKRLIIVDHSNETKELISDRITVIRAGQNSSIVVD